MSDCGMNQTNFQAKQFKENRKIQSSLGKESGPTSDSHLCNDKLALND